MRVKQIISKPKFIKTLGAKPTLTEKEEQRIVNIVKITAELGWLLDRQDIAEFIGNYCREVNKETVFIEGVPGREFMISFLERNKKELTTKKGKILKVARAA